jgi:hypothetical protein
MISKSRHVSVSIGRSAEEVYNFASNPENLPKWAPGLSGSIKNVNGDWVAESPMGTIKVKFADKNGFGILDHDVTLPSGVTFYNPMRVFPNKDGSELIFTVYQRPGMSDVDFRHEEDLMKADLERLKALIEKQLECQKAVFGFVDRQTNFGCDKRKHQIKIRIFSCHT